MSAQRVGVLISTLHYSQHINVFGIMVKCDIKPFFFHSYPPQHPIMRGRKLYIKSAKITSGLVDLVSPRHVILGRLVVRTSRSRVDDSSIIHLVTYFTNPQNQSNWQ